MLTFLRFDQWVEIMVRKDGADACSPAPDSTGEEFAEMRL